MRGPLCAICGEGLPYSGFSDLFAQVGDAAAIDRRCRLCGLAAPPFERAVAYGSYDGALRDLVHLLKFDHVRPAAQVLGGMLADSIRNLEPSLPAGAIAIVPVPLHASKRSHRGFNQAELIASAALKGLARETQQPASLRNTRFELHSHVLVRLRDTSSQIGLTRHQRRENLRGAFAVRDATLIVGRNVLLVDDVYTTGSTASECARVLRRAGAAKVWVATVGRTMKVQPEKFQPEERIAPEEVRSEERDRLEMV